MDQARRENASALVAASGTALGKIFAFKDDHLDAQTALSGQIQGVQCEKAPSRATANDGDPRAIA
jgi:hypothetical protein